MELLFYDNKNETLKKVVEILGERETIRFFNEAREKSKKLKINKLFLHYDGAFFYEMKKMSSFTLVKRRTENGMVVYFTRYDITGSNIGYVELKKYKNEELFFFNGEKPVIQNRKSATKYFNQKKFKTLEEAMVAKGLFWQKNKELLKNGGYRLHIQPVFNKDGKRFILYLVGKEPLKGNKGGG